MNTDRSRTLALGLLAVLAIIAAPVGVIWSVQQLGWALPITWRTVVAVSVLWATIEWFLRNRRTDV
jgi:cobalamin biosynthesis protein CobD/CbiB